MAPRGVERLLNVIMTIGARSRIDRSRLFAAIPEYASAESADAAEKMFERDKAAILDLGLPLVSERDPWDESTVLYRFDAANRSGALDVTPAEYTVLLAASRAWDDAAAGGTARRVRAKLLSLGLDADPDLLRRTPRGAIESLPVLSPLLEAVTGQGRVAFSYRTADGRTAERTVEPWIVGIHEGRWYVLGHDLDREAPRVFRASRIESFPRIKGRATHPRPANPDLVAALGEQGESGERAEAILDIEPFKALTLRDRAGADLEARRVVLPGMFRTAARRTVLGNARWVMLTAPAPWREELGQVLAEIAERHTAPADLDGLESAPVRTTPRIRPSSSGAEHLSRLIGEAAYVLQRGGADLQELSALMGITEKQLVADLQVLFLCGDLGNGWEDLIETEWDSGTVRVRNADALARPLRLSAPETLALLAGLATLDPAAGTESDLVDSARRKLTAHLDPAAQRTGGQGSEGQGSGGQGSEGQGSGGQGSAPAEALAPSSAPSPQHASSSHRWDERSGTSRAERVLAAVQDALGAGTSLAIRYSPPDRPGTSVRRIHPREIRSDGGRSYVRALCELAGEERSFRLDRIVEVLGDADLPEPGITGSSAGRDDSRAGALPPAEAAAADSPAEAPAKPSGEPLGDVWLHLDPPAQWIAEAFEATELREAPEGGTFARLEDPVRSALVDAVLEAAGSAEVLAPSSLRAEIVTVSWRGAQQHFKVGTLG